MAEKIRLVKEEFKLMHGKFTSFEKENEHI